MAGVASNICPLLTMIIVSDISGSSMGADCEVGIRRGLAEVAILAPQELKNAFIKPHNLIGNPVEQGNCERSHSVSNLIQLNDVPPSPQNVWAEPSSSSAVNTSSNKTCILIRKARIKAMPSLLM